MHAEFRVPKKAIHRQKTKNRKFSIMESYQMTRRRIAFARRR